MGILFECLILYVCMFDLWPWLGFLFQTDPGKGFASRISEPSFFFFFPLSENYILHFWRLDSTHFPLPISAHTLFLRSLYCHLLGIGNLTVLFSGPLMTVQSGPWPQRASWSVVISVHLHQFGDWPCCGRLPHGRHPNPRLCLLLQLLSHPEVVPLFLSPYDYSFLMLIWLSRNRPSFPELQEEKEVEFRDERLVFRDSNGIEIRSNSVLLHEPLDITERISHQNQPSCLGHVPLYLIYLPASSLSEAVPPEYAPGSGS